MTSANEAARKQDELVKTTLERVNSMLAGRSLPTLELFLAPAFIGSSYGFRTPDGQQVGGLHYMPFGALAFLNGIETLEKMLAQQVTMSI